MLFMKFIIKNYIKNYYKNRGDKVRSPKYYTENYTCNSNFV